MLVTVVIAGFGAARPACINYLDAVLSDTGAAQVFAQWIDWVLDPINRISRTNLPKDMPGPTNKTPVTNRHHKLARWSTTTTRWANSR